MQNDCIYFERRFPDDPARPDRELAPATIYRKAAEIRSTWPAWRWAMQSQGTAVVVPLMAETDFVDTPCHDGSV